MLSSEVNDKIEDKNLFSVSLSDKPWPAERYIGREGKKRSDKYSIHRKLLYFGTKEIQAENNKQMFTNFNSL
jgi:hypothetical protein